MLCQFVSDDAVSHLIKPFSSISDFMKLTLSSVVLTNYFTS